MAQFGRALGSGPRGRVFESPHSDQIKPEANVSGFLFCLQIFNPFLHSREPCVAGQRGNLRGRQLFRALHTNRFWG